MKRNLVYAMIDGERDYQNEQIAKFNWNEPKRVGEFLTILRVYLTKAENAWVTDSDNAKPEERQSLHEIRKLAALAIACLESHGAPPRS